MEKNAGTERGTEMGKVSNSKKVVRVLLEAVVEVGYTNA